jgi:tRNA(Arg) A34 adenosine deaminase TadA
LKTQQRKSNLNSNQILVALRKANEVALKAKQTGHHPFGALLIAPDGDTVLDSQGNIDTVNHAESTLARRAAANFSAPYLWTCTLVSTVEPCAMCSATQYWANIGRVAYGISEQTLLQLTGRHLENPTLNLTCRDVFSAGQKAIRVDGPTNEMQQEIIAHHKGFWT